LKANTIADKAVSLKYGFDKMVKKSAMTDAMLRDRESILANTVELMSINAHFSLDLAVSQAIYRR
jgi:hypothetical protein